jgi:UDP-3-O-[3-hydroxymyristoyl] glucosamine N-acyltransferase
MNTSGEPRYRLSELSERFGLTLRGDGNLEITGVGTLSGAGAKDISFLSNRKYVKQVKTTQAGAVILNAGDADSCGVSCLISDDPYVSYARIANLFDYRTSPAPGIHASAVIDEAAFIGEQVYIGPNVVIGAGTKIGSGCRIDPNTVIGRNCEIGQDGYLGANVTLAEKVIIGKRVTIHPGAVIGSDGFGLAFATDHWEKVMDLAWHSQQTTGRKYLNWEVCTSVMIAKSAPMQALTGAQLKTQFWKMMCGWTILSTLHTTSVLAHIRP